MCDFKEKYVLILLLKSRKPNQIRDTEKAPCIIKYVVSKLATFIACEYSKFNIMKNLDLNAMGVVEMDATEMKEIDGGFSWERFAVGAGGTYLVAGTLGAILGGPVGVLVVVVVGGLIAGTDG